MLMETITGLFERDLRNVISELENYPNEADIWVIRGGISNSGGNLAQHLIGNIKHFFGAVLGETGFVREREKEFSEKAASREALIAGLEEAIVILRASLADIPDKELEEEYPVQFAGRTVTKGFMVLHLLTHLNYHLGQINYHRRLLSE